MKKIIIPIAMLFVSVAMLQAQTDTLYVMKAGALINKQSIKPADVDSIIFYKPAVYNMTLNNYLNSMTSISSAMPKEKGVTKDSIKDTKTAEYDYHTEYFSAAAGYQDQIVLNPTTDVIYPGALIKGETVLNGTFVPISANRKPIKISTTLTGGSTTSIVIPYPSLSNVRDSLNNLMKQNYQSPPANFGFEVVSANSKEQLSLSLHASYKNGGLNVAGGFNYEDKTVKSRLVAKFIQNYYTVDMDNPLQPSDLFNGDVDKTLFGTYMPMYVSTVTYGRMALFTIESSLSEQEVRASLDASYNDAVQGISVDANARYAKLVANSSMKVYILGGNAAEAMAATSGYDGFKKYILNGGNYSKTSPGSMISYKLKYINDNTIGSIVLAASYPITTATPRTDNLVYEIKTQLISFNVDATDPAIFGKITCSPTISTSNTQIKPFFDIPTWQDGCINITRKTDYNFPDNDKTTQTFNGLKHAESIIFSFNLKNFYNQTQWGINYYDTTPITLPISEIATGSSTPTTIPPHYDKTFTIIDNTDKRQSMQVKFRFTITKKDRIP